MGLLSKCKCKILHGITNGNGDTKDLERRNFLVTRVRKEFKKEVEFALNLKGLVGFIGL